MCRPLRGAQVRANLELAGLHRENCQGVIATTNNDQVNLTVAITVKLLRPDLSVIARSEMQRVCDNMASFNTDLIINPYRIFSERIITGAEFTDQISCTGLVNQCTRHKIARSHQATPGTLDCMWRRTFRGTGDRTT